MKPFYAWFILIQLTLAILARDPNRIEYLKYLWSIHLSVKSARSPGKNSFSSSDYQDTRTEATSQEYSLLLER